MCTTVHANVAISIGKRPGTPRAYEESSAAAEARTPPRARRGAFFFQAGFAGDDAQKRTGLTAPEAGGVVWPASDQSARRRHASPLPLSHAETSIEPAFSVSRVTPTP